MSHILFGDMSQAGLHTLRRAVDLGHRVTLVRGHSMRFYCADEETERLFGKLDAVVDVPDTFDTQALVNAIGAVHADHPVDAVISQCDPMMESLATACERLSLRYTSARGMRNARNKGLARRLVAEAGLPSPRYGVAQDGAQAAAIARGIGYPVVVKPVSGMDSVLARRAEDEHAVRLAAEAILSARQAPETPGPIKAMLERGVLVEEYMSGELVSAEVGMLDGHCHRLGLCGRSRGRDNDCVELGAVLPANVGPDEAELCFRHAEQVCRALGLDFGVFHVELMLTERGALLVEVNPRVMGGVMTLLYKILTGKDFCDYVIDLHLGKAPAPVEMGRGKTITARRVMPRSDGRLADSIDLSWASGPGAGIVNFEAFRLYPGAVVREQEVLGRYAVVSDTWAKAMDHADSLINRFESALGVALIEPGARG